MNRRNPSKNADAKNKLLVDSVGTPLQEAPASGVITMGFGMVALALLVGFVIGFAVWAVLETSTALTGLIWTTLRSKFDVWYFPLAVCTIGGLIIGLWNNRFHSAPQPLEDVMSEVKSTGTYRVKGVAPSIVSFLLPLAFGGSIGPEAGLTGLIAAGCSFIGALLRRAGIAAKEVVELSVSATLSAIFATPFAGLASAANEDAALGSRPADRKPNSSDYTFRPATKGVLYFAAAIGAFGGIAAFGSLFGASEGLPRFDAITATGWNYLYFIPCAIFGYLQALVFFASSKGSKRIGSALASHDVLKPVLCGLVLGACATALPNVLFSGESQSSELMATWTAFGAATLLATGLLKTAITPFCLNMGWNGGSFFPCIFAGVSSGYGLAALCGADPLFCVVVVTSTFLAATTRKPLMTIGLLLLCFPVNGMLWMGLAAVAGAALPLPRLLVDASREHEEA